MSEEKKEEVKKEEAPVAQAPAEAPKEAKKEPEKLVRPAVCSVTGKTLKRHLLFYRDGKWYYNKRVYKQAKEKEKEEKAKAAAAPAAQ